jgi:hypothetical protein
MYIGLHVQGPLFLSDFYKTWIFLESFSKKNPLIIHFTKIRSVEAQLIHEDRETEVTKLRVAFRNFE